ncbi:MAG: aminopeptidase [Candidatus Cloacimonadota bacterium]
MKKTYQDLLQEFLSYKPAYTEQIARLTKLEISPQLPLRDFFVQTKELVLEAEKFNQLVLKDPELKQATLPELEKLNKVFYNELVPQEGYSTCLVNPDYAIKLFGLEMGQLLCCIYTKFRSFRQDFLKQDYLTLSEMMQLYFELFELATNGNTEFPAWLAIYRKISLQSQKSKAYQQNLQRLSPEFSLYRDIIQTADLTDLRYLYRYGVYLSEHDLAMAKFINAYPATELEAIATYIVKSWVDGFVRARKDYKIKNYVNLMIPCGMERLGKLIIAELDKLGLQALVPQPHSNGINRQVSYDHRFDSALILDREMVDISLQHAEEILEELKDLISLQAGPVYVELFGETPFSPDAKASALKLSDQQQGLYRELTGKNAQLYYKYYKRDEVSFCIIAFPSTEIGERFPEIFADTLKINLLDSAHYAKIQQNIIDVLDTAEYVHVKGRGSNETDIMVRMHPITDPQNQTNFENCVADVNIPVGEVFTSPLLTGTNGVLHVEDIYLGSLRYFNIKLRFEDGWVKDYSCTNFENPEDGKKYIHENLLLPHNSLPIGEFAIGTNTLAYQIAKKYDILSLLPILIIEKMGPHFAIGDTCFSHEEDAPHPSFVNGKEMIAVENEHSAKRKEDPFGAYTQKHMDITLPYEMLASITAISKDGSKTDIIRDGLFVVPGTEELNIPLEQ